MSPFLLSVGERLVSELSKTHRSVVPTLRKLREEWGTPIHSHYVGVRHSQRRVMTSPSVLGILMSGARRWCCFRENLLPWRLLRCSRMPPLVPTEGASSGAWAVGGKQLP